MSAIDDLRRKRDSLINQLQETQQKYHRALVAASDLKIGRRYRDKRDRLGEITSLHVNDFGDQVVATLSLIRKDGSLGRTTMMFSWDQWVLVPQLKTEAIIIPPEERKVP